MSIHRFHRSCVVPMIVLLAFLLAFPVASIATMAMAEDGAGGASSDRGTDDLLRDGNLDTDGDGMPDRWERKHGLNPLRAADAGEDKDTDGLTNLQEYLHGTLPENPDTDSDGMGDGWEVKNGLDPLDPRDAREDRDGDGSTNLRESCMGTSPVDPSSFPALAPGAELDGRWLVFALTAVIFVALCMILCRMGVDREAGDDLGDEGGALWAAGESKKSLPAASAEGIEPTTAENGP